MKLWIRAFCPGLALGLLTATCFAADQKPQEAYKANCAGCHGPSGRASKLGKSLGAKNFRDPAVMKTPSSVLAKVIAKGQNQMPPFEGTLTPKEISDFAKYIKEMK